jgi:hypothetical protein
MTKEELFRASGLSGTFDTSLPQPIFDKIDDATGLHPLGSYVWWYPDREDKEYESCGFGGKLMSIARMYALAEQRRYLIRGAEMKSLCKTLMSDVDRSLVLQNELETMAQQEAYNANH